MKVVLYGWYGLYGHEWCYTTHKDISLQICCQVISEFVIYAHFFLVNVFWTYRNYANSIIMWPLWFQPQSMVWLSISCVWVHMSRPIYTMSGGFMHIYCSVYIFLLLFLSLRSVYGHFNETDYSKINILIITLILMPPMPQLSYLICISKLSDLLCCECDLSHHIIVKLDMLHKFIFEWTCAVECKILND